MKIRDDFADSCLSMTAAILADNGEAVVKMITRDNARLSPDICTKYVSVAISHGKYVAAAALFQVGPYSAGVPALDFAMGREWDALERLAASKPQGSEDEHPLKRLLDAYGDRLAQDNEMEICEHRFSTSFPPSRAPSYGSVGPRFSR